MAPSMEEIEAIHDERRKLSLELKHAEAAMLIKLKGTRPTKDSTYPSEADREVFMRGMCAHEIAKYEHLKRLWDVTAEELRVAIMVQERAQHA